MTNTRSRPPTPLPQIVVLPVLRETIRELPTPQQNPFIPSGRQLPPPSRLQARPVMGCLPAFLAMVGVGGCGIWWLVGRLV